MFKWTNVLTIIIEQRKWNKINNKQRKIWKYEKKMNQIQKQNAYYIHVL